MRFPTFWLCFHSKNACPTEVWTRTWHEIDRRQLCLEMTRKFFFLVPVPLPWDSFEGLKFASNEKRLILLRIWSVASTGLRIFTVVSYCIWSLVILFSEIYRQEFFKFTSNILIQKWPASKVIELYIWVSVFHHQGIQLTEESQNEV